MTATATSPKPPDEHSELPRMSFGDHLEELRRRLLISLGAVAVCILGVLPFKGEVTAVYTAPYEQMWFWAYHLFLDKLDGEVATAAEEGAELHALKQKQVEFHAEYRESILDGTYPEDLYGSIHDSPGLFRIPRTLKAIGGLEDFWTFMAAAFLFALILASPIVVYQIWAFIAAGLYPHERKAVMSYMPFAFVLLAIGVLFGYLAVVPAGLFFLIKLMDWALVEPMMTVALYFSFLFTLTAALGLVFQLPLVMLAINKVGLVSHEAMRKNWRFVILGFFLVAAMFTPPDPFTQILMAVPMVGLYTIGLVLTARSERRAALAATATGAAGSTGSTLSAGSTGGDA